MRKVKISFLSILCIILIMVVAFVLNINNNPVKAEEDIIKISIQKFSGKSIDKIKFTEKQNKIISKNAFELSDGEFFYYTDKNGNIQNIIRDKKISINNKIILKDAEFIAKKILKKLNKKEDTFDIEAKERNINEKTLFIENNSGYTFYFKSKDYPGSFVYIDLLPDGNLMGLQVHDEKLSKDDLKNAKLTEKQAKEIFNKYFGSHKVLKKYLKEIEGDYTLQQISFHGVSAWNLTMKISYYDDFSFQYIIDANTGEFYVKSEPKDDGFEYDEPCQQRLQNLIDKEAKIKIEYIY